MKNIFWILVGIGIAGVMVWSLDAGFEKSAKMDCIKWADYAEQYDNFYLTRAEADQCDELGMHVEARVGAPEEK